MNSKETKELPGHTVRGHVDLPTGDDEEAMPRSAQGGGATRPHADADAEAEQRLQIGRQQIAYGLHLHGGERGLMGRCSRARMVSLDTAHTTIS